jgi:alanyl-tRNA synthetase
MTVRELREKYLRFFESKGHSIYPSGSLVPYDVTGRLDESLLFNGAGMIQFKPYFRGVAQPENKRLTTAQKCVRTGDIDEVGDLSHLTFFEMLGNFSFGDYFKAQAIAYSWEFLTSKEWLGLDPQRLSFTIHETDDEACDEWSFWLRSVGIDPASRVFRLGEDTNYWPAGAFSAGPPGPCGPNTEMFYWVGDGPPPLAAKPEEEGAGGGGPRSYTKQDWLRDDAEGNWLEIWNDVFIQYEWQGRLRNPSRPTEGYEKEGMPELPFRSIDTGMGLERTAAALAGHKSVYDTDVFHPILAKISQIRGSASLAERDAAGSAAEEARATRIIADHIRTAVFCIADGILPGNSGRGYVLRRLIRRAVLKGQRTLGIEQPFFHEVVAGVEESMGDHYTELRERRDVIIQTLKNEEGLFRRTLAQGSTLLQSELAALIGAGPNHPVSTVLDGNVAFRLYDTYGFPLEVTQELAAEAGVSVDIEGYEQALKEAQERSRGGQDRATVYGGVESGLEGATETRFVGYDTLEADATVLAVQEPSPRGRGQGEGTTAGTASEAGGSPSGAQLVALDQTPFYASSGGQIGDQGWLVLNDERQATSAKYRVLDVTKREGVYLHHVETGLTLTPGMTVHAQVDEQRRAMIRRNHTATHLLHAALRRVLGTHVTQAGSYVGPDRLRFDFTHGQAMTEEQRAEVESIVNEEALRNTPVQTHVDIPVAEAKARGAMALFGEKYGDKVRMVEVGDFSRELCGGTHVASTAEIGLFKIVAESSAASGVRRIEAVTGEEAYRWALGQARLVQEAASLLKAQPEALPSAVQRTLEQLREERQRRQKAEQAAVSGGGRGVPGVEDAPIDVKGVLLLAKNYGEVDPKIAANALDNAVASNPNLVALCAVVTNGKVQFSCKVGPDAVAKGAHAGNLIREVAKIAGGGGGGRPDFATAGGKDPAKADEALAAAPSLLEAMV